MYSLVEIKSVIISNGNGHVQRDKVNQTTPGILMLTFLSSLNCKYSVIMAAGFTVLIVRDALKKKYIIKTFSMLPID